MESSQAQRYTASRSTIVTVTLLTALAGAASAFSLAWGAAICLAAIGAYVAVRVWEKPELGVYLMAASLPLERIGAVEAGGITIRISQALALLLAGVAIGKYITGTRVGKVHRPLALSILMFLAWCTVSLIWSPNLGRSVQVLAFTAFTMLSALLIPYFITTREQLEKTIVFWLSGALIVSLFGMYQFAGDIVGLPESVTGLRELYTKEILGLPRIQSTAYEPLYFGNYLLAPLLLSAALLISRARTQHIPSWLPGAVVIIGGGAFILTLARGAFAALAVGAVVLFGCIWKKLLTPYNITLALIAGSIAVGGAYVVLTNTGTPLENNWDRFVVHTLNVFSGASFEERSYTQGQAMEQFSSHPLIGNGIGSFGPLLSPIENVQPGDGWAIVNNQYLEVAAELGIIGIGLISSIIVSICFAVGAALKKAKSADENLRPVIWAALASAAAIAMQYATFSTLYVMHIWFLGGFMCCLSFALNTRTHTL